MLSDLTSLPGYQEIAELIYWFNDMSIEDCADDTSRDVALAHAISRIRHASIPDDVKENSIAQIQKMEFDRVLDCDYDDYGNMECAYFESSELGEQADRVLAHRFKQNIKQFLLQVLSFCKPSAGTNHEFWQEPKLTLAFVTDRASAKVLKERWNDACQCARLELILSAHVVLVSVLEGVLVYFFKYVASQATRDRHNLPKKVDDWKLFRLLEAIGSEVNFRNGLRELTHQIRQERNYIHPNISVKGDPLTREGLQTNFAVISELLACLSRHVEKKP